jgi:hypothetical protein
MIPTGSVHLRSAGDSHTSHFVDVMVAARIGARVPMTTAAARDLGKTGQGKLPCTWHQRCEHANDNFTSFAPSPQGRPMSPETLILIDRAKDLIREAEGLIEQHEALAERRRTLVALRSEFHPLKQPARTVDQTVAGDRPARVGRKP